MLWSVKASMPFTLLPIGSVHTDAELPSGLLQQKTVQAKQPGLRLIVLYSLWYMDSIFLLQYRFQRNVRFVIARRRCILLSGLPVVV